MFFRRPSLASRIPQLTKGPRRQKRCRDQHDTRLGLERLEDRRMLAATYVFTSIGDIDIPGAGTSGPANPYPSNIAVSGLSGRVVDVDVTLNKFSHAGPADVDILLVSPSGTASILMSDQGGSAGVDEITLTFDDESPSILPIDILIVAGIYTPSNAEGNDDSFDAPAPSGPYVSSLAVHDGVEPNGNWQLFIMDDAVGQAGLIESWSIKLTVLGPDEFEGLGGNDTLATATVLGSEPEITIRDLTIDDFGGFDRDWYRVTANQTGKLIVNTLFVNADGDLGLEIFDSEGNSIDASDFSMDDEQLIIPVVAQEQYFIEVSGFNDTSPNFYDLEIENFAAPAPTSIDLSPASDTGSSNSDNITSDTTPTLFIQADLVGFRNDDISLLDQGIIDPNNNGVANDATSAGAGVFVTFVNLGSGATTEGFANQIGGSGFLWAFTPTTPLTDGDYFVSSAVQVVDGQDTRRNGRAQLSDPLFITIDSEDAEILANADLLNSSDTGMSNIDNVTNKMQPAFQGIAPANSIVRLFANGELVGQTIVGSDTSDVGVDGVNDVGGENDDGLGLWEITTEPLADNGYNITLEIEDAAGNVTPFDPVLNATSPGVDIVIDTEAPNTPFLDLLEDTGRSDNDNITKENMPQVSMTTTDPNIELAQLLFQDNLKFRIFDRFENFQEFLLYDSALDSAEDADNVPGDMFTVNTFIQEMLPMQFFAAPANNTNAAVINVDDVGKLADGVHNLKFEVEDRAGNISQDFLLEITVDTVVPPVSFGLPDIASETDGLAAESDSGVTTVPETFADRITNDSTPKLWGRAEANSIVNVYFDRNANGIIDLFPNPVSDVFLGQTVAVPFDGNDAFPDGYWEIDALLDLNEIAGMPNDGLRRLLVTAEDVAGNPMPMSNEIREGVDELEIFLDTQGPQVQDVFLTDFPNYDLFDPKPSVDGPTPLVDRITVKFTDLPARLQEFLYPAVNEGIATSIGNYQLVGDNVGNILIQEVLFNDLTQAGGGGGGGGGGGAATGSGGVIIDGGDREEHGSAMAGLDAILGTADDINIDGWQFIQQMVEYAATNGQNSGTGILVVGASLNALDAIESVATVLGIPLTLTTTGGAVDLATVNFNDFAILYVPTDEGNTTGGVLDSDLDTLTLRKTDVQNFVNSGGSLVALTEADYATPYSWLELPDTFTIGNPSSNTQYQTQALIDAGLVITDGELINGTPLHNTFTGPVGFNGLQPFVYNVGSNGVAEDGGGDDEIVTLGLGQGGFIGGGMVMTEVTLIFSQPLPDDRYTLTVNDSISDDAGNSLDGESQAGSPFNESLQQNLIFPSGDGVSGGDFVARFTVDSRPEIGSFVAQNINIDINGNFVWDPSGVPVGGDTTNVDISFTLPLANFDGSIADGGYNVHDLAFAGKFYSGEAAGHPRLFDQLAAYGWSNQLQERRWIIDTDSDGVVTLGTDIYMTQPDIPGFDVAAAIPVAGNFDNNLDNGDEIGLYYAGRWAFDTNRNFRIDSFEVETQGNLFGYPIVGDFDGNGTDDLAVFNNNQFFFDLDGDFDSDRTIVWGFPGVLDRPVAADMDQDGIDDIGLWVPRDSAGGTRPSAEWYFLLSSTGGAPGFPLDHAFTPVPFGNDIYAEFGDELALPIVGNFDPPVATLGATTQTVNSSGNGFSSGMEFLSWQRGLGTASAPAANAGSGYVADFNGNGTVGSEDLAAWGVGLGTVAAGNQENGDANQDGVVTGIDFLFWQRSFGTPSVVSESTESVSTPEALTEPLLAQAAAVSEPTAETPPSTPLATTVEVTPLVQPPEEISVVEAVPVEPAPTPALKSRPQVQLASQVEAIPAANVVPATEVIPAAEVVPVEPAPTLAVRRRPQTQLASQSITTTPAASTFESFEVAALDSIRSSREPASRTETRVKDKAFELVDEENSVDLTRSIPRRRPVTQTSAAPVESASETAEEEIWELAFSDGEENLGRPWL